MDSDILSKSIVMFIITFFTPFGHIWQQMATFAIFFLPISANFLAIFANFCQFLATLSNFYQLVPMFTNGSKLLPIFDNLLKYLAIFDNV